MFSLTKSLSEDKTVRRGAQEKGCDHLKRDISGCKWLHPEFQCRPLIQYFHSGQNWPSLLVMLEQHGRSYPIIPGDAAKQWTVCDPGQTSALRVCPEKKKGGHFIYKDTAPLLSSYWFFAGIWQEINHCNTIVTQCWPKRRQHYVHSLNQKIHQKW